MQFFIPTFLDFLKLREKWPVRQLDCLYVGRSPFAAFAMATKKIEIDSFPHISSFTEINSRERERHDCMESKQWTHAQSMCMCLLRKGNFPLAGV